MALSNFIVLLNFLLATPIHTHRSAEYNLLTMHHVISNFSFLIRPLTCRQISLNRALFIHKLLPDLSITNLHSLHKSGYELV